MPYMETEENILCYGGTEIYCIFLSQDSKRAWKMCFPRVLKTICVIDQSIIRLEEDTIVSREGFELICRAVESNDQR